MPSGSFTQLEALQITNDIFFKAKNKDEFEYACALLRIRGCEDAGWDPLEETMIFFEDLTTLASSPLRPDTKLRLALLTYSHLVEVKAIFEIIANMLRIIEGNRCSIYPLRDARNGRKSPPSSKTIVKYLCQRARSLEQRKLAELLEWMFNDEIRNAFFHSDYVIYKDEFRTRHGGFDKVKINELVEIINRGLLYFQSFMHAYHEHRRSYQENKVVKGRIRSDGGYQDVTLVADPQHGLYGFQSLSC